MVQKINKLNGILNGKSHWLISEAQMKVIRVSLLFEFQVESIMMLMHFNEFLTAGPLKLNALSIVGKFLLFSIYGNCN